MRILVVDDEPDVLDLVADLLEADGHSVAKAANGKQALAAFRREFFRLIITDRDMPGMDGYELCRAIRAERSPGHTYIIMLTGRRGTGHIIAGLESGADEYIL